MRPPLWLALDLLFCPFLPCFRFEYVYLYALCVCMYFCVLMCVFLCVSTRMEYFMLYLCHLLHFLSHICFGIAIFGTLWYYLLTT